MIEWTMNSAAAHRLVVYLVQEVKGLVLLYLTGTRFLMDRLESFQIFRMIEQARRRDPFIGQMTLTQDELNERFELLVAL